MTIYEFQEKELIMKNIYLQITPFFPTKENFRGPYIYDQVKAINDNSDFEVIVIKPISIFDKNIKENYIYQICAFNFIVYDLPSSILPGLFHNLNMYRLEKFIKDIIKNRYFRNKIYTFSCNISSRNVSCIIRGKFNIKISFNIMDLMYFKKIMGEF